MKGQLVLCSQQLQCGLADTLGPEEGKHLLQHTRQLQALLLLQASRARKVTLSTMPACTTALPKVS